MRYSEPWGSRLQNPRVRSTSPRAWHITRKKLPAVERALNWLLGMQNKDGGWAAFDRDINREILTKIPFADHNAMLDPSCPDITARVLEALGQFDYRPDHPQVKQALAFLEKTQDPRGCWIGRWGVNYIYGTWQVLQGLEAIGFDMRQPMVRRAVDWVKKVQQSGGGWGESCQSYNDPSLAGQGQSDRLADRLGPAGPDRRRRSATAMPCATASIISSPRRGPTATGARPNSPAPASPRFST